MYVFTCRCVANIKALYVELGLEGIFRKYEEESYAKIRKLISEVRLPKDLMRRSATNMAML
jgi:hypothetical protein